MLRSDSQSPVEPCSTPTLRNDRPQLAVVSPGEAALLAAHRKVSGTSPELSSVPLADFDALLNELMEAYGDVLTDHYITEAHNKARLLIVDRMVQVRQTA